jgi:predicted nucleic acid-binding protein
LQTGDILTLSLELFDISIPEIVVTELKEVAGFNDTHGKSARNVLKLIKERRISVKELVVISETELRVDVGEMACLNLCKQEQIPILVTDDWRALPKLIEKSASIKVVVSAFVIRSLLNKRMLTGDNAKAVLDKIARDRDWLESKIYEESKKWLTK